jgi:hypothetical protein
LEFREGEPLIVADEVVGAGVVAVERAGGAEPPLAGIGEPEEPVRAAARGTPDRLFDLSYGKGGGSLRKRLGL